MRAAWLRGGAPGLRRRTTHRRAALRARRALACAQIEGVVAEGAFQEEDMWDFSDVGSEGGGYKEQVWDSSGVDSEGGGYECMLARVVYEQRRRLVDEAEAHDVGCFRQQARRRGLQRELGAEAALHLCRGAPTPLLVSSHGRLAGCVFQAEGAGSDDEQRIEWSVAFCPPCP